MTAAAIVRPVPPARPSLQQVLHRALLAVVLVAVLPPNLE